MNSSNFKNIILQKSLLEELAKPKSKYRKILIKKADSKLIQAISESIYNLIDGNIPIDKLKRDILLKHKALLRKIVDKSTIKKKKKLLVQRGWAILPTILPLVLSAISNLFGI